MVTIGQKFAMQTALVSVGCNDKFYKMRALFDTVRPRTYITERLVKVLKAKHVEHQNFSLYSFESTKANQKTLPVVDLSIKIKQSCLR